MLLLMLVELAQGAGSTMCPPPTPVTHQSLIWKLNMIVSLPTTYIYALLYMPSYYLLSRSPYWSKFKHLVTMLDASKAFDKVNHSKLFTKLIDRAVLLLLCAFFITGTELRNSLSDCVVASQNFLPFQTLLSRVKSFLHIFLTFTWMT